MGPIDRKTRELRAADDYNIGMREVDDQIGLVSVLDCDLGYFDKERDRMEPGPSPLMPDKV